MVRDDSLRAAESFSVTADGCYVGEDGFHVPKDFREFFERDPLQVRRWLRRRLAGRLAEDTILDLEQDLLLYLCSLSPESRFRRKGTNGRPDGCEDVIQCFDPVRHFGATAARFHHFINLCLAKRLSSILAKQRRNPLCDPRNVCLANFEISPEMRDSPEHAGEVDESYLLKHSRAFARKCRRRSQIDDAVREISAGAFGRLVERGSMKLLPMLEAMEENDDCDDPKQRVRADGCGFQASRRQLRELKQRFFENRIAARKRSAPPALEIPTMRTQVFLREELYERVWTTPVHRLAKEFGYSDVGLAKLCHKHQIPTPGLGYWRRLELGHKPARTPLPVIEQPSPYRIEVEIRERVAHEGPKEECGAPVIQVIPERPLSHPLVVRLERLLSDPKRNEKGLLVPRKGEAPHLLVTETTLPRALQVLDVLFASFEQHKIQIAWPKEERAKLTLTYESETIGFCFSEIQDCRAHIPSKEDNERKKRDYFWSIPKWDYRPTGLLRIALLCGETTSTRKTWSENKQRKIEVCLGDVVVGVEVLVEAIQRVKAERQRWREEFEARQRREREAEEQAREFARRGEVVVKAAQALQQSQWVRHLAVCLGNSAQLNRLDNETLSRMRELLEWCSTYANQIDPTCHPEVLLDNFYKRRSSFP